MPMQSRRDAKRDARFDRLLYANVGRYEAQARARGQLLFRLCCASSAPRSQLFYLLAVLGPAPGRMQEPWVQDGILLKRL